MARGIVRNIETTCFSISEELMQFLYELHST